MRREISLCAALFLLAGCAARVTPPPASAPAPVPIPAPPRRIEPPAFTGLDANALAARLGAPAFSRKDGTTDMWRYDSAACHAFFFFTGGKIAHVETVPRGPNDAADPACLNALKKTS